jgi:hypothetical protein
VGDDLDRLIEVGGDMIWPTGALVALAERIGDQHGATPRAAAALDVTVSVADHPGSGQIKVVVASGLQQKIRFRLTA